MSEIISRSLTKTGSGKEKGSTLIKMCVFGANFLRSLCRDIEFCRRNRQKDMRVSQT